MKGTTFEEMVLKSLCQVVKKEPCRLGLGGRRDRRHFIRAEAVQSVIGANRKIIPRVRVKSCNRGTRSIDELGILVRAQARLSC